MSSCSGYKCTCKGPFDVIKGKVFDICGCSHTVQTHKGKQWSAPKSGGYTPVYDDSPKPAPPKSKGAVSVSKTVLTPAEARAKLKAAGIPVGERGRLSPAQMTQAARL